MIILTDDQAAKVREILTSAINDPWVSLPKYEEALGIVDGAQRVEVVAKIDQLNNTRMFTLTEGAGYGRFDNLYAVTGETK